MSQLNGALIKNIALLAQNANRVIVRALETDEELVALKLLDELCAEFGDARQSLDILSQVNGCLEKVSKR